ncbi:MAG: hypothetical protein IJV72_05585 [Clostridia bacterium]|nr:hypothetical protein [Clostridia bacterium]
MKKSFNSTARYISVLSVFVVVMLVYVVVLAVIQVKGAKSPVEENPAAYTRTVTVSGLRGEIYDRNGVLLVGNSTSYDLILEYGAIPDTTSELNRVILEIFEAIEATESEDKLCEDYYIFHGTYPRLHYLEEVTYSNSPEYEYLAEILDANGIEEPQTVEELEEALDKLVDIFISKYKLDPALYSPSEITTLLRVRYGMERIKFGVYQPYTIASDIDMELVSYIKEANIEEATLKVSSERHYEYPGYASHILGRLGKIQAEDADYYTKLGYPLDSYVGTSGCEKEFEEALHGQDGTMEISYDADGNIISEEYIKQPISGNDVYLTIDIELQIEAEDSLRDTINSSSLPYSEAGAVVALDPNNGDVLAIASYPTYDLTQFGSQEYFNSLLENPANPLFDRALLGEYAPGSIYKLGSALSALENEQINRSTEINCSKIYPHLHNPTCLGTHGDINVIKAIGVSCNCFFYEIGMQMGIDKISQYTTGLGLGVPTGIELPERTGTVAGSKFRDENGLTPWGQGDDLSAVIGQSDHTYTPLQLGVFVSSISNGGDRYNAHLLHSVKKFYTGETVFEYTPTVLNTVEFSQTTYDTLIDGMRQVILESPNLVGYFDDVGVTVGGKTGTAEVSGKKDFALFAGVAPLDNPEIVAVCVLEEGVNGRYAAIPVSDIFKKYFVKIFSDG